MSTAKLKQAGFNLSYREIDILRKYSEQEQRSMTDVVRELIRGLEVKLKE